MFPFESLSFFDGATYFSPFKSKYFVVPAILSHNSTTRASLGSEARAQYSSSVFTQSFSKQDAPNPFYVLHANLSYCTAIIATGENILAYNSAQRETGFTSEISMIPCTLMDAFSFVVPKLFVWN